MSRDLRIRGNDYAGRSHIARGATRELNVIQLARRIPSAFASGRMVSEQENDHAQIQLRGGPWFHPFPGALVNPGSEVLGSKKDLASTYRASMQTGTHPSLGLFASVVAMVSRRRNDLALFPSRASFKLANFFNAVFEVAKSLTILAICFFGGFVITAAFISLFFVLPFVH